MTFSLDFRPRRNGLPYDPVEFGGSVDQLRVYTTPDRTGVPLVTVNGSTRIEPGLYRFEVPTLADGRYFLVIVWTEKAGDTPYEDRNDSITLPIVDPDVRRLRRLIDEPDPDAAGGYSDGDLAVLLSEYVLPSGRPDLHAAAAAVWEEKAAVAAAAGGAGVVQSVSTGDQSVTYAAGKTAAEHALGQARYHRARSHVRSVRVTSPRSPRLDRAVDLEV